jgi:uncharacterized protein (UPF0333 family)
MGDSFYGGMCLELQKSNRGSITAEAAIVVPVVIVVVVVLLYILLLMFQSCILQVTANHTAERAASLYYNSGAQLETGGISTEDISKLGMYRRWRTDLGQKSALQQEAERRLQENSILKSSLISVDMEERSTPLARSIRVQLRAAYPNPLGSFLRLWGLGDKIELTAEAKATVKDPAEFIRNTDFIIETAAEVPVLKEFSGQWQQIVHKIMEYINRITKEQ